MRRNQAFWIALAVFLALAAYLRYFESRRPADAPKAQAPLLEVEPVRVRAITCTAPPDSTRLERKDGAWRVTWPVDFPADPVAVEALLSRCRKLEVIRSFRMDAEGPARYGFNPPRARIQLDLTDGSSTVIEIGALTPASPAFYVRVAGRNEVGSRASGIPSRPRSDWNQISFRSR